MWPNWVELENCADVWQTNWFNAWAKWTTSKRTQQSPPLYLSTVVRFDSHHWFWTPHINIRFCQRARRTNLIFTSRVQICTLLYLSRFFKPTVKFSGSLLSHYGGFYCQKRFLIFAVDVSWIKEGTWHCFVIMHWKYCSCAIYCVRSLLFLSLCA